MQSRAWLILWGCLWLPALGAEPAEQETPATATPPGQTAGQETDPLLAEAAAAAAAPPSEGPSEESFTPSVQISEDLSVSFPVDI